MSDNTLNHMESKNQTESSADFKIDTADMEIQNELWIEAIKDFNKKEHTQDGRNLLMEKFIIMKR